LLDTLVMTLGFEPGPLVSSVASHAAEGFTSGARIVVLTPNFPDERADRAWRQLCEIFEMMRLKDLGVELERMIIDLNDFTRAVIQLKEFFSRIKGKRTQISLTGGMRALILATLIAYLLTEWENPPGIEVFLEGRGFALKIPNIASVVKPFLDENKMQLLRAMLPGKVYRSGDLCKLLRRDRSTVYRYLRALSRAGLIERVDRGFRLTELGEMLR